MDRPLYQLPHPKQSGGSSGSSGGSSGGGSSGGGGGGSSSNGGGRTSGGGPLQGVGGAFGLSSVILGIVAAIAAACLCIFGCCRSRGICADIADFLWFGTTRERDADAYQLETA